ncbi:hypothetical protein DKX38_019887 [Salix brachista]|uniref:AMP-dependent synthetase/ligase domain-containing protein n=1 Tax=Salix brachista TaxID=2182728 RepID=A0A5N5KHR6_9ROSI|nr:hypothetical protein DKX38_019887 [Salix brachista]
MVENGDPGFKWVQPKSEWDPVVLNYTSGTPSSPKGVVQSHRGIFIVSAAALIDWGVPKQPVYLWALPIFHTNGWSHVWGMAAVGGTNICLRKVEASTIYSLIDRHGVTHMSGAPVVLNILTKSPDVEPLRNPVHIITAGAPPPEAVILRTESLGFVVSHGYGLTETAWLVVSCAWKQKWNTFPASERARLKARQGVTVAGFTEMDVVNPSTGESVKRDGPGFSRGSSFERWVLNARNNMPHFMVPKTVVFKDDQLPRTSTGKIQKFVLKEIAKGMGPKT